MSAVSTDKPSSPERHLWYYLAMGVVAGAAVIAFAVLPTQLAGLALVAAAVLIAPIDFLAHRFSASPFSTHLRRGAIIYLVVLCVVMAGALVLVWTVMRNGDALWLAWAVAGLLFLVVVSGAWIVEGRSTHKTVSAAT